MDLKLGPEYEELRQRVRAFCKDTWPAPGATERERAVAWRKQALAAAKAQVNRATLPPDADLLAAYGEFATSLTWPGFQARLPQLGKLIAEIGLDEVERRLGYYIGIGNQQP